jgi:UPF0271 protein
MTRSIDLNADMGEGYGPWQMGDDAAMLKLISSANIACGAHAGDPQVMARTMALAHAQGVAIGAHPGFADLQGFGRRRMHLSPPELTSLITYQTGAAIGMAHAAGTRLSHFKLHGALSNMACEDITIARTCFAAALALQPDLALLVLPHTALEAAARDLGADWRGEIFADRTYQADGTLTDRSQPGAMIHEPKVAAGAVMAMLAQGAIRSTTGRSIPARIDTVCVHGDSPSALGIARHLRDSLMGAGYRIAAGQPSNGSTG